MSSGSADMKRNYEVLLTPHMKVLPNKPSQNALRLLDSRRRNTRPKTPAISATSQDTALPDGGQTMRGLPSLVGMKDWLRNLGHSVCLDGQWQFCGAIVGAVMLIRVKLGR